MSAIRAYFPQVVDSTIIDAFRSCPQKAFREYVQHWKTKGSSIHLHAGAAYASGIEAGRKAFYIDGKGLSESERIGLDVLGEHYGDFDCPSSCAKTKERMMGALDFYFANYPMDTDQATPIEFGGRTGIEFCFAEPLPINHPVTGEPLIFSGRSDMVCNFAGGTYILDDKTTSQLGQSWSKQWEMRGQFSGYCLKGTDEVLTPYGWVRLDNLSQDMEVAQWDEGNINFVLPSKIHSPYYEGKLITANGKINLCATPDHRQPLWDTYSKKLKTFAVKDIVQTNGSLRFISAGILDGKVNYISDFIRLLAAFQADGSWKDGSAMSFHFSKDRKAEDLIRILTNLEVKFQSHTTQDGSYSYRVNKEETICQDVMELLGPKKLWGNWLLELSQANLQVLVDEVQYWDGTTYETKHMYFSTIKQNVEWIATICHLAGLHTSTHVQNDMYRLVITKGIRHSVHTLKWGEEDFSGRVYCITVPSSYFLVRSQGTIFVTGNCWAARELGLQIRGVIIRGVSILKTKYETQQCLTYRSNYEIDRWYDQTCRDLERMVEAWKSGYWDFNLGEACGQYGGCKFVDACKSHEPDSWIENEFQQQVWDPLAREQLPLDQYIARIGL